LYDPLFPFGYGLTYAGKDTTIEILEEYSSEDYGCNGDIITKNLKDTVISIFNGSFSSVRTPWMGDPSNWAGRAGTPASEIPNLKVAVAADNKGENSKALHFMFKGSAYWGIGGEEQDMSVYYVNDYHLTFDVYVHKQPEGKVKVVVLCTYPCQDEVDITSEFQAAPVGTWRKISIPLKKFKSANFLKISSPFQIFTTDAVDFSVANIRWER
jgi:beta-glucosidase